MASHLLIIGERQALAWVLRNERMAFPSARLRQVAVLAKEDDLLIYTTRGCFHNPTRDRGRVIARAIARTTVTHRESPLELAGRRFGLECSFDLLLLAPFGQGVEFSPLVRRMRTFPNKDAWSARMRRPLLTLARPDAALVSGRLEKLAGPPRRSLDEYIVAGRTA
jgi:hypothetical protein